MSIREENMKSCKLIATYTLAFCVMFCAIFCVFYQTGHSLIRTADGLNQYYTALSYYGELLRKVIRGLFVSHQLSVPMFDLNIGYGGDVLTTLHYYGIGEPLSLLAVFFEPDKAEICFTLLFILRFYLAGLVFAVFCYSHGHNISSIVVGSLIYVFSGYSLYLVTKYVAFAIPLICLPLLFLGIDRVLEKKKPCLYIIAVFFSAISNFYFFYMTSIFMVIYAVLRFLYLYSVNTRLLQKNRQFEENGNDWQLKRMFSEGLHALGGFVLFYFAGFLLSMPIMLPIIKVFLQQGRNDVSYPVSFLYKPIAYFVNLLNLFFNFNGSYLGYSFLFLPVLIVIFRKKTHWIYKVVVFVIAVFLCIPFFGSAMNGFAYVSERYQFGMAFAAAYLISCFFPNIYKLSRREKMLVSAAAGCLMLLACVIVDDKYIFLCMIVCSVGSVLLLWMGDRLSTVVRIAMPFLGLSSIVLLSQLQYRAGDTSDSIVNYLRRGGAAEAYQNSLAGEFIRYAAEHESVYEDVAGGGTARYAQKQPYGLNSMNQALLTGVHGMQFYFSMYNNYVAEFNRSLAINAVNDFRYSGVEGRSILLHLLNAGYLVVADGNEVCGFAPLPDTEGRIQRNTVAGSIGYTYRWAISYEEWQKMSAVERQYAMLQAAVICEKGVVPMISFLSAQELSQTYEELEYECRAGEGIAVSDREWNITDTDANLTVSVGAWNEELQDCLECGAELYMILEGVHYDGDAPIVMLEISTHNMSSQLEYITPIDTIYTGRHDFICNLGTVKEEVSEIQITFQNEGIYSFDSMKIVCQPMEGVNAYYDTLYEEAFEEVEIDTNVIRGKISVTGNRLFVLAVPYSEGFRAYVDGQQVAVMRVNEMMMGINLTAGEHEIMFHYTTPGLRTGWLLCLCGLTLCIGIGLYRKRN